MRTSLLLCIAVLVLSGVAACKQDRDAAKTSGVASHSNANRRAEDSDKWEWYDSHAATWDSWEFMPLKDEKSIARTTLEWASRRLPSSPIDEERLADDLAEFLVAWSHESAPAYLDGLREVRQLPAGLSAAPELDAVYRRVRGQPAGDPRAAIEGLWNAEGELGRPTAVSRDARLAIGESLALSGVKQNGARRLFQVVKPKLGLWDGVPESEYMKWIGYSAAGLPRATENRESFDALIRAHDRLVVGELAFVVRTSSGDYVPMQVSLYQVPESGAWRVESLVHAFPEPIAWPY